MAISSFSLLRENRMLVESSRCRGHRTSTACLLAVAGLALLAPAFATPVLKPSFLTRPSKARNFRLWQTFGARNNFQSNLVLRGGGDAVSASGDKNFGLFRNPVRQESFQLNSFGYDQKVKHRGLSLLYWQGGECSDGEIRRASRAVRGDDGSNTHNC
jgi:hypothetical protein